MFTSPTYCNLFGPFNEKADEITNIDQRDVREEVMSHGRYAEKAALFEMREHKIAWTTNHWTGPNDETYFKTGLWSHVYWISKCSGDEPWEKRYIIIFKQ